MVSLCVIYIRVNYLHRSSHGQVVPLRAMSMNYSAEARRYRPFVGFLLIDAVPPVHDFGLPHVDAVRPVHDFGLPHYDATPLIRMYMISGCRT
jgi:hypothetical protein